MSKQQTNAGGILKPDEVKGQDLFIKNAWRTLENQGLYITGERRMGKSSIVRDKMGNEPLGGYKVVYFDVSGADTPFAFVNELFGRAKEMAGTAGKFKLNVLEGICRLAPGLEIAQLVRLPESLSPSWKEILNVVLTQFANAPLKCVLVFDEMPLMLDKIKRTSNEADAMDILDTLRKARQSDNRLRMIYTGSLGLHHVLTDLQAANYQNAAINDLKAVEVGPLDFQNAKELAWRLINGMEIPSTDPERLAQHVARITNGIPFYIQHLMSGLADADVRCEPETADQLLAQRLTDLTDPWDLGYHVTRITTHYQKPTQAMAFAFLDLLALAPTAQTRDEILSGINPQKVSVDEDTALPILTLLGKDHYITQNENGAYHFRYQFIARVWISKRGLTGKARR